MSQRQYINKERQPLQPVPRYEKTLSRVEIQWLINLIDRHLTDLSELLSDPDTSVLECNLAQLMQENYAHVRGKLSATLENNWTRIYIKQPIDFYGRNR